MCAGPDDPRCASSGKRSHLRERLGNVAAEAVRRIDADQAARNRESNPPRSAEERRHTGKRTAATSQPAPSRRQPTSPTAAAPARLQPRPHLPPEGPTSLDRRLQKAEQEKATVVPPEEAVDDPSRCVWWKPMPSKTNDRSKRIVTILRQDLRFAGLKVRNDGFVLIEDFYRVIPGANKIASSLADFETLVEEHADGRIQLKVEAGETMMRAPAKLRIPGVSAENRGDQWLEGFPRPAGWSQQAARLRKGRGKGKPANPGSSAATSSGTAKGKGSGAAKGKSQKRSSKGEGGKAVRDSRTSASSSGFPERSAATATGRGKGSGGKSHSKGTRGRGTAGTHRGRGSGRTSARSKWWTGASYTEDDYAEDDYAEPDEDDEYYDEGGKAGW